MVFNSITFLVFLAIVLVAYYRLGHKGQNWILLVASYVFYGWWDFRFLGLLLFTTLFDYFCALWIQGEERPLRRKFLLASSMAVNRECFAFSNILTFLRKACRVPSTPSG